MIIVLSCDISGGIIGIQIVMIPRLAVFHGLWPLVVIVRQNASIVIMFRFGESDF